VPAPPKEELLVADDDGLEEEEDGEDLIEGAEAYAPSHNHPLGLS